MKSKKAIILVFLAIAGCKKPYSPPPINSPGSYLVVEGVINAGADSTIIKLSRTVDLDASTTANPFTGATMTVEGNNNVSYPLSETSSGTYTAPPLNLDNTRQYRLNIKTPNNQQYLSDFVPVNITPPIDSVGFTVQANGIQIYVNTHDPNNNTRYYRWDYAETWQFHSEYYSQFISNGQAIVPRTAAQLVFACYGNDISSNIVLGSSAKLSQDVIYQNPIIAIASNSEKLETEYSILVNEYALTADAYNFYLNMEKNTEQLGSIFDAQPSEIPGNIHNVNNAAEPVIGYVSVCTVQSKRIFISSGQLPSSFITTYPYSCSLDSNYFANPHTGANDVLDNLVPLPNSDIPTTSFYLHGGTSPAGYLSSDVTCVDCTLRGTTVKPSFWK